MVEKVFHLFIQIQRHNAWILHRHLGTTPFYATGKSFATKRCDLVLDKKMEQIKESLHPIRKRKVKALKIWTLSFK